MDNERIKALVQSYVDELFAHDDMSDQENIEDKNDAFIMCMAFAGHILENHCIVEKDQARELAKLTLEHGSSEDFGLIDGLTDWVCYNFDDEYREEAEK